ncbi:MAG: UDP-4-amino-4,6-dideoxy-N-acetyl-beta-L-altrosamine N-acetyltransferase [Spirosomataceae bacterium]
MISYRKIKPEDIEMIRYWRNSKEVSQYMYSEKKIEKEQQVSWFNSLQDNPNVVYDIIQYNEISIGLRSITNINRESKFCDWAFYIGEVEFRSLGLGTVIEYDTIEYVFEQLQMSKLYCEVLDNNKQVINLHEKFGFRREGFFREHILKDNKRLDVVKLALLKKEWKHIKPYFKTLLKK